MAGKLAGKVSIVTASTEGIGFAIAKRFLREGSKVVVSSRRCANVDKALKELQPVATAHKTNVMGLVCHVGKSEDRESLVSNTIAEFGQIDVLVSNAAVSPTFGSFLDTEESAFDKVMDINVKSGFLLSKLVIPHMLRQKSGSILFIGSIAGYFTLPGAGAYSLSKTALLGMTKTLSQEVASQGIRVNCIAPGIIKTSFSAPLTGSEDYSDHMLQMTDIKRFGEPEEVAGPAVFLASDDSSYITGETLLVSGGMPARL